MFLQFFFWYIPQEEHMNTIFCTFCFLFFWRVLILWSFLVWIFWVIFSFFPPTTKKPRDALLSKTLPGSSPVSTLPSPVLCTVSISSFLYHIQISNLSGLRPVLGGAFLLRMAKYLHFWDEIWIVSSRPRCTFLCAIQCLPEIMLCCGLRIYSLWHVNWSV